MTLCTGRTVICSIHQPRADVYDLFDRVVLLSRGCLLYSGPGGSALPAYLHSCLPDRSNHLPPHCNVADWILDVCSVDARSPELEVHTHDRVQRLVQCFAEQQEKQESKAIASTASTLPSERKLLPSGADFGLPNSTPFLICFPVCAHAHILCCFLVFHGCSVRCGVVCRFSCLVRGATSSDNPHLSAHAYCSISVLRLWCGCSSSIPEAPIRARF
jgi:hypothetical protein